MQWQLCLRFLVRNNGFLFFFTISDNFDNSWQIWQFLTTLTISDNFGNFSQIWQILKTLTIFDNFHNSDNFDYLRDLRLLRHWLQLWKLRTWIHENLCSWQSRIKLDSLRNFCNFLVAGLKACALMSVYLMPFLIDSLLVTLVWNSAYQVTLWWLWSIELNSNE